MQRYIEDGITHLTFPACQKADKEHDMAGIHLTLIGGPTLLIEIAGRRLLTDPTFGGVSASYAMLGDVHIAEPGARIGFSGQRVIEQTIREKLPEGFQRAEFLLDHGIVDMVTHRHELRATLSSLVHMLMKKPRPRSRALTAPAVIEATPVKKADPAIKSGAKI